MWLFAIEAVRFNLGMKERAPAAMRLRRQKCRAQYISLFKHRLQRGLADDEGVDGDDEAANEDELLQALEAKLTLAQVLLYRTLAKRAVAEVMD